MADVEQRIWDDPPPTGSPPPVARRDNHVVEGPFEQNLIERGMWSGKQVDAPPELRFVSQPKGVDLDLYGDGNGFNEVPYYAYRTDAKDGFTIYIIDSGANPVNIDYAGMYSKRWLKFDDEYWLAHATVPKKETDERNHGCCVASKAAGKKYGVAKQVSVVIAKLGTGEKEEAFTGWYIYTLSKVLQDIVRNNLYGKAVVNMAVAFHSLTKGEIKAMRTTIETLLRLDVVVVISSGNDKVSQLVLGISSTSSLITA